MANRISASLLNCVAKELCYSINNNKYLIFSVKNVSLWRAYYKIMLLFANFWPSMAAIAVNFMKTKQLNLVIEINSHADPRTAFSEDGIST